MNTLARPAVTVRRPRLSLWSLRVVTTVHLVLVLAQPVLAGLFLTGDVDAIEVHGIVGSAVAFVSIGLIVVTVAYVVRRGRLWVLPAAALLFVAAGLQAATGFLRVLQAHVPLGVAIVVASVLLTVWVWSPAATQPRGGAK